MRCEHHRRSLRRAPLARRARQLSSPPPRDAGRLRGRRRHRPAVLFRRLHARRPHGDSGDQISTEQRDVGSRRFRWGQPGPARLPDVVLAVARGVPARREARLAHLPLHRLAATPDHDRRFAGGWLDLARHRPMGQDGGLSSNDGPLFRTVRIRRLGFGGANAGGSLGGVSSGHRTRVPEAHREAPPHRQDALDDDADRPHLRARRRHSRPVHGGGARPGSPPCARGTASSAWRSRRPTT